jgi:long-chain acyl-CoA synthetase
VNHPFRLGKGSVGKVLAGREVKLGEDGEIMVRGGGVADSYWSGQQRTPVASEEGWFGTGDIGALDAEGNLYFKGRKKDVIVTSAGMNVYPEDLEAALNAQPEVEKCVVIGLNHDGNAEACAVLILRDGAGDAAQVVERANRGLAEHQKIRRWVVWPEKDFPRTATQKPKTREIARVVESGLSRGKAEFASPLRELITRVTGRVPAQMQPDADLDCDLNLSSLERVELMSAIEDRYQTDLSETSFSSVRTTGDVERILRGESADRAQYHYPRWTLRWPVSWIRILAQYGLVLPSAMLLGWPGVEGGERLEGVHGPVLVICNHISHVDVGLVQAALPGRFRRRLATATGGEALEALRSGTPGRGWIGRAYDRVGWALGVALLNLFPLPREAGFRESFSYAGEAVDRGYSILIFPEGHHTTDGRMRPFREGIALLAKNLRIPVVPMRIDGLFELKQAGKRVARPGRIRIKIGDAVRVAEGANPAEATRWLQKKVEEL